jgi:hypothetical protein
LLHNAPQEHVLHLKPRLWQTHSHQQALAFIQMAKYQPPIHFVSVPINQHCRTAVFCKQEHPSHFTRRKNGCMAVVSFELTRCHTDIYKTMTFIIPSKIAGSTCWRYCWNTGPSALGRYCTDQHLKNMRIYVGISSSHCKSLKKVNKECFLQGEHMSIQSFLTYFEHFFSPWRL